MDSENKEIKPLPDSNYNQKIKRIYGGKNVNFKTLLKRYSLSSKQILGFLRGPLRADFCKIFAAPFPTETNASYALTTAYNEEVALELFNQGGEGYSKFQLYFKNFKLLSPQHKLEQLQKKLESIKDQIKGSSSYSCATQKAYLTIFTYWFPDLLSLEILEEYLELGLAIGHPKRYSGDTLKAYAKNLKSFYSGYSIDKETLETFACSLANQEADFIEACLERDAIPSDILKFRKVLSPKEIALLLKSKWWEAPRSFEGTVCDSSYYTPLDKLLEHPLEKEQFNEILCSYVMEEKEDTKIQLSSYSLVQALYHLDRRNLTKLLTHEDPILRKAAKFFYERCPEKEDLAKLLEGGS